MVVATNSVKPSPTKLAALMAILLSYALFAGEVDHFSVTNVELEDSRLILNKMVNEHIKMALSKTRKGCREKNLYKNLRKHFNNVFFGKIVARIASGDEIDKVRVPIDEGIYRDFWFANIPLISRSSFILKFYSEVLRVGDSYLGFDKLEHIWGSGYFYFKIHYLKQRPLEEAFEYGEDNENGHLGMKMSGVASYADLAANFNGMRFWNHILQKGEDPMGQNLGPYIECQEGKGKGKGTWAQVKAVDMADYVDHSFDERINCTLFATEKLFTRVKTVMAEKSKELGIELTCPMDRGLLELMDAKYQDFSYRLLNFKGHYHLEESTEEQGTFPFRSR